MSDQVKHIHMFAEFGPDGYRIEKGPAMAVHGSLGRPDFYPPGSTLGRDYDTAFKERIQDAIEQGLINQGKFDDRKPRFSGIRKENGVYIVQVGVTHFEETRRTNIAAIGDRGVYNTLRESGKDVFNDSREYFAYNFAADAVPVSEEGHVLVFRRDPNAEIYPGHWQDIGGMIDTDFSFWDAADPSLAFRYLVDARMIAELNEEVCLLPSELNLRLTGLVDGLGTVDFTYIANSRLTSDEIIERRKRADDAADHTEDKVLRTPGEVVEFLLSAEPLSPVGVGAMLFYLKEEDLDAFGHVVTGFSQYPLSLEF